MVVMVIELLSPANKRTGVDAADAYECKRREIIRRSIHLIEIDLLRGGRRPSLATLWPLSHTLLCSVAPISVHALKSGPFNYKIGCPSCQFRSASLTPTFRSIWVRR